MYLVVNFKIMDSGANLLGFESLLYHLLAVLPWASYLCFHFLIHIIGADSNAYIIVL